MLSRVMYTGIYPGIANITRSWNAGVPENIKWGTLLRAVISEERLGLHFLILQGGEFPPPKEEC